MEGQSKDDELVELHHQLANCVTDRQRLLLELAKTPVDTPARHEARKMLGWAEA